MYASRNTRAHTDRVILDVLAVAARRRYLEHAAAVGTAGHLNPWPEVLIQRHVPQQHSLRPQARLTNEKRLQVPDQCAAEVRVPLATRAFYDDNSGAVTELHVYIALYHVVILLTFINKCYNEHSSVHVPVKYSAWSG